jgi:hypothetical protein
MSLASPLTPAGEILRGRFPARARCGQTVWFITLSPAPSSLKYQIETSAKDYFVILSVAKDLAFPRSYEIFRSLRSLRMIGKGTLAEVSNSNQTTIICHSERSEESLF